LALKDVRGFHYDDFVDNNEDEMEMSDDENFGKPCKRLKVDKPKRKVRESFPISRVS
jgi:hypothetical protein